MGNAITLILSVSITLVIVYFYTQNIFDSLDRHIRALSHRLTDAVQEMDESVLTVDAVAHSLRSKIADIPTTRSPGIYNEQGLLMFKGHPAEFSGPDPETGTYPLMDAAITQDLESIGVSEG